MTRPAPSFVTSVAAVARFALVRHLRSRRAVLGVIAVLVLLVAVAASRATGETSADESWKSALAEGLLSFVCYVLPFLFHASSMSEEHEDRTLTYLLTRPVARSAILLGKYVAGASLSVALGVSTTLALYLASYAGSFGEASGTELARALLAVVLLSLGHGAIATAWSTVTPEQATPVTVVHFVVFELGPRMLPSVLRMVSMHHHASDIAGVPRTGFGPESTPELPIAASSGIIVAFALFFLFLSILVASGREYRFARS